MTGVQASENCVKKARSVFKVNFLRKKDKWFWYDGLYGHLQNFLNMNGFDNKIISIINDKCICVLSTINLTHFVHLEVSENKHKDSTVINVFTCVSTSLPSLPYSPTHSFSLLCLSHLQHGSASYWVVARLYYLTDNKKRFLLK